MMTHLESKIPVRNNKKNDKWHFLMCGDIEVGTIDFDLKIRKIENLIFFKYSLAHSKI